jgi:two-component system, cell cycle sensor histidine kinase and response regulator CckA
LVRRRGICSTEEGAAITPLDSTQLHISAIEDPRAFLAGLFDHAPVAFQVYGVDGRCLLVNQAYRTLFGSPPPSAYNIFEDDVLERQDFVGLVRRALAGETQHVPAQWYDPRELMPLEVHEGRRVAIEATLFPLRDRSGAVSHVALCFKDATAELTLRSAVDALEQSERRFRATFDQAAVGIAHVAPNGTWLEVNQRLCDIVGYSAEELRARTFQDITHPPDLDADLDRVDKILDGSIASYSLEKRYIRKDGALVWIDLTVSLVRDAAGAPAYFISLVQDISARKEVEERLSAAKLSLEEEVSERRRVEAALRANEQSLATTLNSIGDAVIATDATGRVTRMNPVAEQLTGWILAEARGAPLEKVFRILNETTRQSSPSPVRRVLAQGAIVGLTSHTVLVARDGGERPIADSAAPIRDGDGSLHGVVLVFRDQTDERAAATILRKSEATKAAILHAALDCIVTADQTGLITEFNPAAERTFGYARTSIIGKPLTQLVPFGLRERHLQGFDQYLKTGVGPILGKRVETSALHADGTEFPVELAVIPTRSEDRLFFTAYIRDISDRQRAAQALQASEARFKHLADSGIIGIVISDIFGNIHEANDAFLELVGFSRQEIASGTLRWADLTAPEWRAADAAAVEQLRATGVAPAREKEYTCKDGSRKPVMVGVAMLEPPRCIAFVLDLTPQRRAEQARAQAWVVAQQESVHRAKVERVLEQTEEQLRQSQKMEAIGLLAGSVAHDFNNLLSVILGYAEMLVDELQTGDPIKDDLIQIRDAATRASELTQQLLAFGRRQVLQPRVLNLNVAISDMTRMLARIIGEDIELAVVLSPDVGAVFVDPNQIEQVLLNLVVNARDAMPQGGKLTIETSELEVDEAYAAEHLEVAAGRHVMLAVGDTGAGMNRATQARVFEPFFTTKELGKGTGLGLSTVYGIVKQSGGAIWLYSELGKGTVFKVYLPRTDMPSDSSPSRTHLLQRSTQGHETILLVEDDGQVRALASAILRRHGYHVLTAANGGDALLICEQFLGGIDLLLTDVVMPRMSGRELWERLKVLRPVMKVLFMSGYTDDAVVRHGVLSSELAFVQKPLTPAPLLAKLRLVLDG